MNAVVESRAERAVVPTEQSSENQAFLALVERVMTDPNVQIEKLNALLDMKIKWDAEQERKAKEAAAEQARKEFTAAMVEFKKLVPAILKDKHVEFNTSKGVTSYDHATIGAVCDAIIPALAQAGLTHSWEPKQENGRIFVTCTLSHPGGHTKSVALNSAPEDSGTKNAIQAVASAITYLERYTLLLVCGVATGGMPDDDGARTGAPIAASQSKPEIKLPPDEYARNPETGEPVIDSATGEQVRVSYVQWADNLRAVCDEGAQTLLKVWKSSPMPFRAHMVKHEAARWDGMKKLAEGASRATEKAA